VATQPEKTKCYHAQSKWHTNAGLFSARKNERAFFAVAARRLARFLFLLLASIFCMISLALLAFVVSLVATLWARRVFRRYNGAYAADAPQRFHFGDTPRMGSLGLLAGWALALVALPLLQWAHMAGNINPVRLDLDLWLLMLLPAFGGGVLEDMTQRLTVRWRLLLTLSSGMLAWVLLGVSVTHLGFGALDSHWRAAPWLGVALAVLAMTGLPHAFNIIDGYNGLAGMVALVVCLALAHVALQVGDRELAAMAVTLAAATAGFLMWNYPRGLIFAGDAGAYLWGLLIAAISLLLVQRHPAVSPWFPVLLLIYPVWETVFSIYRKLRRGVSPGMADALHLHQLVYRRLVRSVLHEDEAKNMLARNNRTAPYLWSFIVLTVVPAVLFWRYTGVLMGFCLLFVVSYVVAYLMLVRFKVPRMFQRPRR
jgi:UDP-N-acetylmuramyl pentapeptide phosphotransferase/UDP-N-acetylglucosamine-1-phosphate transferase